VKREREREKDADARARENRERERERKSTPPSLHARVSLSLQKKRAKERKNENLAASTVCVPSFFSEMSLKNARGGKTREREIAPNVAKLRSGVLTSRESIAFFLVIRAR
jgi:hypothetical protein